jgi:hypothetical protein
LSARAKLNAFAIKGTLIVAAIVGLASNSSFMFLLTAGILLALAFHAGDIQPSRRR